MSFAKSISTLQTGRAKGSDANERALKFRIRSGRYIVKGQSAIEDHAVGIRTQCRDVAHKP